MGESPKDPCGFFSNHVGASSPHQIIHGSAHGYLSCSNEPCFLSSTMNVLRCIFYYQTLSGCELKRDEKRLYMAFECGVMEVDYSKADGGGP